MSGYAFSIYPEGTRGHLNGLQPFREGSFKSAYATGVPIIPITYLHTDDVYENHRPWVRATDVTVVFGKPIPTVGRDRAAQKALSAEIREQMAKTYAEYV